MNEEALRQQRLLGAIGSLQEGAAELGLRESGTRARRGLLAYRANAQALAERALGAAFPTLRRMVGAEEFGPLAAGHWRDCPPRRGDLGEWGDGFAEWLETRPSLHEWPWLADCARLDFALHRCERAADESLDAPSLRRLDSTDPAAMRLVLAAGAALIDSRFPIVTIHAAHAGDGDEAFAAVRAALDAGIGETAFVARSGWRATVQALDAPTAAWTRALLEGASLAAALAAAGAGFDFAAWLATALRAGWLKGSAAMSD